MQIRKCLETEIVPAGDFFDGVVRWLDEHVNFPRWIYKVYPSEDSVRAMVKSGSQYLCLEDGKIIGAFGLNTEPQGCYRKGQWSRDLPEGAYMVLHALAIDPAVQRQGVATAVIRFCMGQAKAEGFQDLRLDVVPDNYPARALFERNGFTYAGDVDLELPIGNIPAFSLYELVV